MKNLKCRKPGLIESGSVSRIVQKSTKKISRIFFYELSGRGTGMGLIAEKKVVYTQRVVTVLGINLLYPTILDIPHHYSITVVGTVILSIKIKILINITVPTTAILMWILITVDEP